MRETSGERQQIALDLNFDVATDGVSGFLPAFFVKGAKVDSIKQGATDEEIAEAAFVAMALRAGAAFAHSSIAMAVSDEQRKSAAEAHSHEGHNH